MGPGGSTSLTQPRSVLFCFKTVTREGHIEAALVSFCPTSILNQINQSRNFISLYNNVYLKYPIIFQRGVCVANLPLVIFVSPFRPTPCLPHCAKNNLSLRINPSQPRLEQMQCFFFCFFLTLGDYLFSKDVHNSIKLTGYHDFNTRWL